VLQGLAHFAPHCRIGYDSASHNPNGEAAMGVVRVIVILLRVFLFPRLALAAENLALRQQLAVLQVLAKRPRLRKRDRIFWVWLSWLWSDWRSSLMIVKPETVIRWHREGFRLY
jgi:putative transposase